MYTVYTVFIVDGLKQVCKSHFTKELNTVGLQRQIFCYRAFVHFQLILKHMFSTSPMI